MKNSESISRISEVVLSFQDWDRPWDFRHFVLKHLPEANDAIRFEAIWAVTMKPENWDQEDLSLCAQKTIEILQNRLGLAENVANQIANAAAYQWQ